MTDAARHLPLAEPNDNAPEFFSGLAQGQVRVQVCDDCDRTRLPMTVFCPHCGGARSHWRAPAGVPTLHSFSIVHRAPTEEFEPLAPYGIGVVEFEPGCRLVCQLDWEPTLDDIDTSVAVDVVGRDDGFRLEASRSDATEAVAR